MKAGAIADELSVPGGLPRLNMLRHRPLGHAVQRLRFMACASPCLYHQNIDTVLVLAAPSPLQIDQDTNATFQCQATRSVIESMLSHVVRRHHGSVQTSQLVIFLETAVSPSSYSKQGQHRHPTWQCKPHTAQVARWLFHGSAQFQQQPWPRKAAGCTSSTFMLKTCSSASLQSKHGNREWAVQPNAAAAAGVMGMTGYHTGRAESDNEQPQPQQQRQQRLQTAARLLQLAFPLFLQYAIGYSAHLIDTGFVGHLSDPMLLSSMVLGTSYSMATGYSIVSGLASASETLSGQAYGARDYAALGATLQRSISVCSMACLPITAAWVGADMVLPLLGQDPAITAGAARYLLLTLPALYMHVFHECLARYLNAQQVVQPGVVISAITTALTPLYCYTFIYSMGLQLDGAAYAYVLSQATGTALTVGYVAWRQRSLRLMQSTPDLTPSMQAFQRWGPYLALAVPATLMACLEGWAIEVLILFAGMLKNAEVAVGVTGLCLQFSTLVWMAAASIGSSTAILVANRLGKGDAVGARRISRTALGMVLMSQSVVGLTAYSLREPLVRLLTSSEETVQLAMEVMPVLACCFVADGLNVVFSAVWRGTGRQWWGAGIGLIGWWGVGVPTAALLSLHYEYNVAGLWGAFALASTLQAVAQYIVYRRLDWDREVQRAHAMMDTQQADSTSDEEPSISGAKIVADATGSHEHLGGLAAGTSLAALSSSNSQALPLLACGRRRTPRRYLPSNFPNAPLQALLREGDGVRTLVQRKSDMR